MMFEFQVGQIESLAILEALKQYAENKDNNEVDRVLATKVFTRLNESIKKQFIHHKIVDEVWLTEISEVCLTEIK